MNDEPGAYELAVDETEAEPRERRGRSCLGVVGTLFIVLAVIVGTVMASPLLDLGDLRDAVTTDPLDGVQGSGGDGYTYLMTTSSGAPITWPCGATIDVVVNPEHAPDGYEDLLASSIATVNEAAGVTFRVAGETDERTFGEKRVGDVLLGWADADEVGELHGATAGIGGATYATAPGGGGHAIGGSVVLDVDLPGGWFRDKSHDREMILTHELLHVLGLGHTDDPTQLMAPEHRDQDGLGEGDLAGLEALRQHACG
ncbi:matrixin family metalloprotease [Ornithinimicrobium panacihumi]|uniref:matrixin family metalloprotease n=1 Tax=Ornithinimicrobium panacihumi TaxID=2008449 RepID=UPI003F8AA514